MADAYYEQIHDSAHWFVRKNPIDKRTYETTQKQPEQRKIVLKNLAAPQKEKALENRTTEEVRRANSCEQFYGAYKSAPVTKSGEVNKSWCHIRGGFSICQQ